MGILSSQIVRIKRARKNKITGKKNAFANSDLKFIGILFQIQLSLSTKFVRINFPTQVKSIKIYDASLRVNRKIDNQLIVYKDKQYSLNPSIVNKLK